MSENQATEVSVYLGNVKISGSDAPSQPASVNMTNDPNALVAQIQPSAPTPQENLAIDLDKMEQYVKEYFEKHAAQVAVPKVPEQTKITEPMEIPSHGDLSRKRKIKIGENK